MCDKLRLIGIYTLLTFMTTFLFLATCGYAVVVAIARLLSPGAFCGWKSAPESSLPTSTGIMV